MVPRPCVLIVDDDGGVRYTVRRTFTREFDVDVVEAPDGLAALEKLASTRVDLVILDLDMPLMNGIETLEAIRQSSDHASVPVVVLSGRTKEHYVRQTAALDASDFLAKPVAPDMLAARCQPLLERVQATLIANAPDRIDLRPSSSVLVVEEDDALREFLIDRLKGLCRVDHTDSAVSAMRQCLSTPPDVLLLGRTTRLMPDELLARKLRETKAMQHIQLVRLSTEWPGAPPPLSLPRTTDPGAFLDALRTVVSQETLAHALLSPASPLLHEFHDQFTALLSMGLGGMVESLGESGPSASVHQRHAVARLEMHVGQLTTDVIAWCSHAAGVQLVDAQCGIGSDRASDQQIAAALSDFMDSAGQVLAVLLARYDLAPRFNPTAVRWFAPQPNPHPPSSASPRWFTTSEPGVIVRLTTWSRRDRPAH